MVLHCMQKATEAVEEYVQKQNRENAYKALCKCRTASIQVIMEYTKSFEKMKQFNRRVAIASKVLSKNVKISHINPYKKRIELARKKMIVLGNIMFLILDDWQKLGGTFKELCNLCNISEEQGYKLIDGYEEQAYSNFIFVCNLDYKNTGDWLETIPEAPLTTCIKEYMLDQMINTEHGKKASDEALKSIYPELFEMSLPYQTSDGGFEYMDELGEIHHIDEDGVEI